MSVLYSAYKKTEPTFLFLYEKLTQNLVNGKTNKCARKYNKLLLLAVLLTYIS